MTELEIYKFIHNEDEPYSDNVKEYHWQRNFDNGRKGELTLYIWVEPENLKKFCNLLGYIAFDEGGICESTLCYDGSICISNFDEVLEYYEINAENIVPKNDEI